MSETLLNLNQQIPKKKSIADVKKNQLEIKNQEKVIQLNET